MEDFPRWFCSNGIKMDLSEEVYVNAVVITHRGSSSLSPVARLEVKTWWSGDEKIWQVNWVIDGKGHWTGRIKMTVDQLLAAFGLREDCFDMSRDLARRYKADIAVLGKFIRKGNYVNFTGPGTGSIDANLSLRINTPIKNAISELVEPESVTFTFEGQEIILHPGFKNWPYITLGDSIYKVYWKDGKPTNLKKIEGLTTQDLEVL